MHVLQLLKTLNLPYERNENRKQKSHRCFVNNKSSFHVGAAKLCFYDVPSMSRANSE